MRNTAPKDAAELEALETREWLESLDYVLQSGGPGEAHQKPHHETRKQCNQTLPPKTNRKKAEEQRPGLVPVPIVMTKDEHNDYEACQEEYSEAGMIQGCIPQNRPGSLYRANFSIPWHDSGRCVAWNRA